MVGKPESPPCPYPDRSHAGSTQVDVSLVGSVSHGWQLARLGDVCTPPEYGASAPARPFDPNLPRYVRITDLTDDGRLRVHGARSADPTRTSGYLLSPGDLLFARSGATAGKTYLYREEASPTCFRSAYSVQWTPQVSAPISNNASCSSA